MKNSTVTRGWVEFVDETRAPVRVLIGFAEQAKAERTLGAEKSQSLTGLMYMTRLALIKSGQIPPETTDAEFEETVAGIAVDEDEVDPEPGGSESVARQIARVALAGQPVGDLLDLLDIPRPWPELFDALVDELIEVQEENEREKRHQEALARLGQG